MATFSLSPAVEFTETDLTTGLTAVATSIGAFAGEFEWGPVNDVTQVTNEADLVARFGKPNTNTYNSWFTAYNFLSYSNDLRIVRAKTAAQRNAVAFGTSLIVENILDWETRYEDGNNAVGMVAAKYPGTIGNSLKVSMADKATYSRVITGTVDLTLSSTTVVGTGTSFLAQVAIGDKLTFSVGASPVVNGGSVVSLIVSAIASDTSLTVTAAPGVSSTGATTTATWEYASEFAGAPFDSDQALETSSTGDGMHIVVIDVTGKITGVAGGVVERLENVFKSSNAKKYDGTVGYYKNALRDSKYLWWMDHPTVGQVSSSGIDFGSQTGPGAFKNFTKPMTAPLTGGADGYGATQGELQTSFGIFADDQKYDVSLVMTGKVTADVAKYVIQNVAERRRDCVAFVSPVHTDNSVIVGDTAESIEKIVAFRNLIGSSSYAFMDSGFKYQYDKYNDVYRYIALNGDIAGITARSMFNANEWASPAGYNRGNVKNVTRLAVNPNKPQRDDLFKNSVNFVVSFPNSGPVLFSDKTLLDRASDFDAIGIRLLFILLEKTIASSARFFLFEQNTQLTRKLFVSLITPFLRDIQGRGGISEFFVDVGPNVNTDFVVQSKTFAANIYIKSTKSIRFIKLNFIATPEGVSFSEITGQSV